MQEIQKPTETDISDGISLMISILLCYPQIGSIKLHPEHKLLKFTFILSDLVTEENNKAFQRDFIESEETFFWLNKVKHSFLEINFKQHEEFTLIEVKRDVGSLSQDEISLIVALFVKHFHDSIIIEDNEYMVEEDLLAQEELIAHMLENLKAQAAEKPLIAYREEGRVLVFDK